MAHSSLAKNFPSLSRKINKKEKEKKNWNDNCRPSCLPCKHNNVTKVTSVHFQALMMKNGARVKIIKTPLVTMIIVHLMTLI